MPFDCLTEYVLSNLIYPALRHCLIREYMVRDSAWKFVVILLIGFEIEQLGSITPNPVQLLYALIHQ